MNTQYNKAIVSLIMAVIMLVNTWKPGLIPLDETTVNTLVAALWPVLVFLIPNKTPTATSVPPAAPPSA